jgi:hypothetical protein
MLHKHLIKTVTFQFHKTFGGWEGEEIKAEDLPQVQIQWG